MLYPCSLCPVCNSQLARFNHVENAPLPNTITTIRVCTKNSMHYLYGRSLTDNFINEETNIGDYHITRDENFSLHIKKDNKLMLVSTDKIFTSIRMCKLLPMIIQKLNIKI